MLSFINMILFQTEKKFFRLAARLQQPALSGLHTSFSIFSEFSNKMRGKSNGF